MVKKVHVWLLLSLCGGISMEAAAACQALPHQEEQEVLDQLNLARKDPAGYAFHLENLRSEYDGKERHKTATEFIQTQEGLPAVNEAIMALQKTEPRGELRWDSCLGDSALEHVQDTGPSGLVGHESSQGESSGHRIGRYVKNYRMVGENISYGAGSGQDVVEQLLIDDGVPDRGHRKNIFEPRFNRVGIACGPHAKYGTQCVIDFAQE